MRIAGWLAGCNAWNSIYCSQPASQRSSSSVILIASDPHPHPQRSSSSAIVIAGSRYAMRPSHACTQILIHTRAMCGDRAHGPASGGAPRGSVWPLPCGGCVRQVLVRSSPVRNLECIWSPSRAFQAISTPSHWRDQGLKGVRVHLG